MVLTRTSHDSNYQNNISVNNARHQDAFSHLQIHLSTCGLATIHACKYSVYMHAYVLSHLRIRSWWDDEAVRQHTGQTVRTWCQHTTPPAPLQWPGQCLLPRQWRWACCVVVSTLGSYDAVSTCSGVPWGVTRWGQNTYCSMEFECSRRFENRCVL